MVPPPVMSGSSGSSRGLPIAWPAPAASAEVRVPVRCSGEGVLSSRQSSSIISGTWLSRAAASTTAQYALSTPGWAYATYAVTGACRCELRVLLTNVGGARGCQGRTLDPCIAARAFMEHQQVDPPHGSIAERSM